MRQPLRVWPHKLWSRLFQARRSARRLKRALAQAHSDHGAALRAQADRYEEQLALERSRYVQMQTEWSSRLVQLVGLQPMLVTDLESGITDPKYRPERTDGEVTDLLNEAQHERFLSERERFFEEGIELGSSPAEIRQRWTAVKDQVVEDLML